MDFLYLLDRLNDFYNQLLNESSYFVRNILLVAISSIVEVLPQQFEKEKKQLIAYEEDH